MSALAILLVLAGALTLWRPAMVWTKAWAAPSLIERAWDSAAPGKPAPQPWPWADGRPVAVLSAPDLGLVRYVLDGASARLLAFGPARLSRAGNGSGTAKATMLFGQHDTHFKFLRKLTPGMTLHYTGPDRLRRRFTIATTRIAEARTLSVPDDRDALVLITGWPFDANGLVGPKRFVVTAWPANRPVAQRK